MIEKSQAMTKFKKGIKMENNIWREAAERALLIETGTGTHSFLALWTLPIESKLGVSLSSIYEDYKGRLVVPNKISLTKRKPKDATAELVVALVEEVYNIRVEEAKLSRKKAEAKERLELLEELKDKKELDALASKSKKELDKEIADLKKTLQV